MNRMSRLVLLFSIAFAVLITSPAFLNKQFGPYPLMKTGDVTDLLTPLILIPLYWLMYQVSQDKAVRPGEGIAFLVVAAIWVEGQGMHLSANSIGHLLKDQTSGDPYALTYFYDEVLSHYLWHTGVIGLSALILWRQWRHPLAEGHTTLRLEGLAGAIYGFTYFVTIVEAGTAPIGVPFAIGVTLFGLTRGRRRLRQQPLLGFFFIASLLATILFGVWWLQWGGLPQFSEVGIID